MIHYGLKRNLKVFLITLPYFAIVGDFKEHISLKIDKANKELH